MWRAQYVFVGENMAIKWRTGKETGKSSIICEMACGVVNPFKQEKYLLSNIRLLLWWLYSDLLFAFLLGPTGKIVFVEGNVKNLSPVFLHSDLILNILMKKMCFLKRVINQKTKGENIKIEFLYFAACMQYQVQYIHSFIYDNRPAWHIFCLNNTIYHYQKYYSKVVFICFGIVFNAFCFLNFKRSSDPRSWGSSYDILLSVLEAKVNHWVLISNSIGLLTFKRLPKPQKREPSLKKWHGG